MFKWQDHLNRDERDVLPIPMHFVRGQKLRLSYRLLTIICIVTAEPGRTMDQDLSVIVDSLSLRWQALRR